MTKTTLAASIFETLTVSSAVGAASLPDDAEVNRLAEFAHRAATIFTDVGEGPYRERARLAAEASKHREQLTHRPWELLNRDSCGRIIPDPDDQ